MKTPDPKQLVSELVDLFGGLLVPFMGIERDMPSPCDISRNESDTEHVFTLAMTAVTVNERLGFGLDNGKLALYALVHDLVEAYAGDVSILADEQSLAQKAANEAKAYQTIRERYAASAPWIANLIHIYEQRGDAEAKFIYAIDKHMGALSRMSYDAERIEEAYPQLDGSRYKIIVGRLRAKVATVPELLDFFDELHGQLDQIRHRRVTGAAGSETVATKT